MKIGDMVKYRGSPESPDQFASWLGIIIEEIPGFAEYKKVQWVNSENRNALETVNHKAKDLWVINEDR